MKDKIPMYEEERKESNRADEIKEFMSGALKITALVGILGLAVYYDHELTYAAFGIATLILGIKLKNWISR